MLYERWRQVAQAQAREIALCDLADGKQWTFADLARGAESTCAEAGPVFYPRGHSAEFVFAVLQAWRRDAIVCPLEVGQKPPRVPLPPASCVHLKTTSATTGAARAVVFTAEQLAADAENIVATMGLRPDWPNLAAISMAHSYGFSNLVLPLLLYGIPLAILPSPLPEALRRAAAAWPALTLAGVPALWRAWSEAKAIPPNVRLAISAGAPLPLGLEREVFSETGVKIHNFYGSSECGGIAYENSAGPRSDAACVGAALANVSLSLNEEGCVRVRSRAVGETYWPKRAESLGGGCFETSDLAEFEDGRVYLRGRLSDQINVAGRKVSPATIERVLSDHEAVRECLVFGVPSGNTNRSEAIVACVAGTSAATARNLQQYLLTKLPAWQVPREWWFVESLQPNCRGKIPRGEWRRQFLERQAKRGAGGG